MNWNKNILSKIEFENISNLEEKKEVAKKIVEKAQDGQVIGFGSGSTSYLATIEMADRIKKENKPDWSFDGADEVDEHNWLIKGRGGAMFKEKLNIANSPITYILIDKTKIVDKLGSKFKVPVECFPEAINFIKEKLIELGGTEIELRKAVGKDGPIITENNNLILDVKFDSITENLEEKIKFIPGVIESGLFINYNVQMIC